MISYLKQKGKPIDYWHYKERELDKVLGKLEAKTKKGENYTVASLRYRLNRGLKWRGHAYNIITSESFSDSQQKFNYACLHLKTLGKGYVKHYKEIKPSGMYTINISKE